MGLATRSINLAVDLTLKSENGEEFGTIPDLTSIKLSSRVKNRELFFNLTLSLDPSSTPPGKYLADFDCARPELRQDGEILDRFRDHTIGSVRPASGLRCRWQFGGVSAI